MKFYQTNFDINSTYFLSDLHLYHNNFLKDYNFSNMENYVTFAKKQIIETITEEQLTLGKSVEESCLFILGDICMKFTDDVIDFIQSIPCRIFLLQGNHDNFKSNPECKTMFEVVADILDIQILDNSGQKYFRNLITFSINELGEKQLWSISSTWTYAWYATTYKFT